jgi:hypothetical protein
MKKTKIEPDMEKRIIKMANKTWQMIGPDILRTLEEEGENPVIPKSHVVEAVCDADYMLSFGDDREAYKFWDSLPTYKEKEKVVAKAFQFSRYGW